MKPKNIIALVYAVYFAAFLAFGLIPVEAIEHQVSDRLFIPAIDLDSNVTTLTLSYGGLNTPDEIVGSFSRAKNKTLLIGHSDTVFRDIEQIKIGDTVLYAQRLYKVSRVDLMKKTEVNMNKLLKSSETDTIIIMTCAGERISGDDFTHRLMITAV